MAMKPGMRRKIPSITLTVESAMSPRRINTVQDAVETLLDHWPIDDGEEYLTAVHVCLDAIHGRIAPEAVRDAMVKAAEEAGVSVLQ
ncbi:DUF982 domain-containing protein [Rhizobium sp. P40RR-XXII]|uniref:DUF982 domain-containing protein n=1 Tax=Rhizobium sp. P40RR-XXII TaxID=2726739 RepID=UPI001FEE607B|nr:DUF982 domain-containing protein [Rhizobium sp. P40RR-XXII]